MTERFPALVVTEPNGSANRVELSEDDLNVGDVTIAVSWSSLNYKDALALTGKAPVVRRFPMVCGIDLAGTIVRSSAASFRPGDEVVVTGCGLGEQHFGGYAGFARVPADWCVALPDVLSARQAMALGTAGVTAMLAVLALERNGSTPVNLGGLPLLVTGAAGGVGSLAIAIAARLGYQITASTGRLSETEYLRKLGASEVIDRAEISSPSAQALGRVRFGAAIDVVGGDTLNYVLATTRPFGTVAACGLVGGYELATTVHPFILRGVTLAGIHSVFLPAELRAESWHRLMVDAPLDLLDEMTSEATLGGVFDLASRMLAGEVRGRVVVKPSA